MVSSKHGGGCEHRQPRRVIARIRGSLGWLDNHLREFVVADTVYGLHEPDFCGGERPAQPRIAALPRLLRIPLHTYQPREGQGQPPQKGSCAAGTAARCDPDEEQTRTALKRTANASSRGKSKTVNARSRCRSVGAYAEFARPGRIRPSILRRSRSWRVHRQVASYV
jgi:hypothetical protein